ncbi:MAG: TRAM domain-containing protein, partial [Kiritimatiellae bacterium]|nr:TRAM domain-containing protein [Kiritimatiellia bacterium]
MTSSIYIAKSVYGGDGLGRLGDGRVVFVPGAFPGEQVKAEIVQEKKSFVKARLVEIEDASQERTGTLEPPIPIPGAVYWNLSVKGEKAVKSAQLAEFFDRNRIALPPGCDLSECSSDTSESASLNYRNKVVYHFSGDFSQRVLGYREEPSHKIV